MYAVYVFLISIYESVVIDMTDEQLGSLLESFAHFYWSIPVTFVTDKIADWHPEVTARQAERVLQKCIDGFFWHHCYVMHDGVEEPELVTEHLVALGGDDFDRFIAARISGPYYDCDEETLLRFREDQPGIPEADAIIDFGKAELGLDDEWAEQLVHDCVFSQPNALCDGKSWVMEVLSQERYGKIQFRTLEQVRRFRDLGNKLYQAMPNPVLKGWKPSELDHPPALLDDIPEKDEDIPDGRPAMDAIFAPYGGREKVGQLLMQSLVEAAPKKRKIGRNEPCPCGSGKKYKKCCGRY